MKKLSPQEIEKDIQTASNKEFTPAGKVGIKRLSSNIFSLNFLNVDLLVGLL